MGSRVMTAGPVIGRFWTGFVKPYRGDIIKIAPVLVLVAIAGASYGVIMKYAVDAVSAERLADINLVPVAVIAATCVRAAAMWSQSVMCQSLALKVLRDMQNAMFAKLMQADFALFSRQSGGRLVSRFTNDIAVISDAMVRALQVSIRDALTLLGAVATMIYFDWMLTLLVIGLFAIAGPPLAAIARRARKQTEIAQSQMGALNTLLAESFGAARFVKTYGLEGHEIARAHASFEQRRKNAMKLTYNRARAEPLLEIIGGLALAGVLFIAGLRVAYGHMTLGDLLGMVTAIGVAAPAARALGNFNTVMNEAVAALSRLFGLLDEPIHIKAAPHAKQLDVSEGRIAFDNVGFSYGKASALDDVSFVVEPGKTVALVGPSGAGKSTVFNLLPRLYDVTGGTVRIDGQDIRDVTMESLRQSMALVSQEATLFHDTVRANIALGRKGASDAEIIEAAKAAAAHEFIIGLPLGYDTPVGERGGSLSGGERQRVALARAFLRDAPILLLDEATSALDAESEAKVQEALSRLTQGRTTLVIAHRLATVRDADLILVMENGRIVERGAHADLVARDGLYARLSRLQFQD
jgi:subfamily B ATP-binding cassette protein MsbA